jgi:hypothetical protein
MFTYALQLLELLKCMITANKTNLKIDSNEVVLSEVRQNQATACQAMVARHAKNYDLHSFKEGDLVKLPLPKRFFRNCPASSSSFVR